MLWCNTSTGLPNGVNAVEGIISFSDGANHTYSPVAMGVMAQVLYVSLDGSAAVHLDSLRNVVDVRFNDVEGQISATLDAVRRERGCISDKLDALHQYLSQSLSAAFSRSHEHMGHINSQVGPVGALVSQLGQEHQRSQGTVAAIGDAVTRIGHNQTSHAEMMRASGSGQEGLGAAVHSLGSQTDGLRAMLVDVTGAQNRMASDHEEMARRTRQVDDVRSEHAEDRVRHTVASARREAAKRVGGALATQLQESDHRCRGLDNTLGVSQEEVAPLRAALAASQERELHAVAMRDDAQARLERSEAEREWRPAYCRPRWKRQKHETPSFSARTRSPTVWRSTS